MVCRQHRHRAATISALLALVLSTGAARGEDFYQGKTVNLIVGVDAGSGYDAYGRLLARHMPKYMPGKPVILVQNMPGAASITAAQHLYVVAPKDGTAFGILFPGALVEPLTGDPAKYRYDPTKFEYIGTADSGTRLCFTSAASKVRTFADARTTKVLMASTASGSSSWDYPHFLNALGGSKFEVITGYKGPADLLLAMERGEAEGVCGLDVSTVKTLRPDWFAPGAGKAHFLAQAGLQPKEELTKLGIPSIWEFITGDNRQVAELIVSQQVFGRPFVAPPGVPEAQLKILRTAFMASWGDPELVAEAAKMKLELNPKGGEEVGALIRKTYAAPKDLLDRMTKAIRP
jgi:tripartite-type tricarboxylate transporter receptor subunit TctC